MSRRISILLASLALLAPVPLFAQPLSAKDSRILERLVEQTLQRYREEAREATAKGNPGPAVNLAHVERLIESTNKEGKILRAQGINPRVAQAAMVFSDLGKNSASLVPFANEVFPDAAGKDQGRFLRAFLLHEVVGLAEFRALAMEAGLTAAAIGAVERANVGHNGPAVEGTWWHENWTKHVEEWDGKAAGESRLARFARKYLGKKYPRPTTPTSAYHTALDRRDQGTRDGSLKIMAERMNGPNGESLEKAFDEAFRRNQTGTQRQFNELRRLYPRVFEIPSVQKAEQAVAETVRYANHVRFSEGGTRAEIVLPDNRVVEATSLEEFAEALERISRPSDKPLIQGAHSPEQRLAELRKRTLPELVREARRGGLELEPSERTDRHALLARLTGLSKGGVEDRLGKARAEEGAPPRGRRGASRRLEGLLGPRAGRARPRGR